MYYLKRPKLIFAIGIVIIIVIIAFLLTNKIFSINNAAKGSFKNNVEELINAINEKQLLDKNFNPNTITNENIKDILNIPDDNYSSINITSKEDKVYINIAGKGEWKYLIACGSLDNLKVVETSSKECDVDYISPVIKLIGEKNINISAGSKYNDLGATATDNKDGNLTDKIKVDNTVNTNILGSYKVTYRVTDSSSNTATLIRMISVVDDKGPIISFKNNGNNIGERTDGTVVTANDEYSDVDINSLKYVWTTNTNAPNENDFKLSFINGKMINVPINKIGVYYLWVFAKDSVGNITITGSNSFSLISKAPIITLNGSALVYIPVGSIYTDEGATAIDDMDGNVTNKIVAVSNIDVNIPGAYVVLYKVKDSDNSTSSIKRIVNVIDNVSPVIKFETNGNSAYAKSYSTNIMISDKHSKIDTSSLKYIWTTSIDKPSEDKFITGFTNNKSVSTPTNVTGSYYLWILAKDSAGNISIEGSNAFNLDNTPPVITMNGNNTIDIDEATTYTDLGATATDNIDEKIFVIVTGTVNPNFIGKYTIIYTATDVFGNESVPVIRTVNVKSTANAPVLATGMTPIKWVGNTWVDTTTDDSEWYKYDETDKRWANARTEDGSMWVWIPRYIYKISSGWHQSYVGKNMITDSANYNNRGVDLTTGNTLSSGTYTIIQGGPIWVNPNTTYTITRPINSGLITVTFLNDIMNTYLGYVTSADENSYTYTFTTPANCRWIKIFDGSNMITSGYQLEAGSVATTYEPIIDHGIIDIQFSKGTNDDWNSTIIGNINTGTTAQSSNNTWTNHPAFNFGGTQLTGIWVAKFEASSIEGNANGYTSDYKCPIVGDDVSTKTIRSVPNVQSWRCINVSNAFTATRNMENNSVYGWGTSGTDIDTHLIKNVEWGSIAYLSHSKYGKGEKKGTGTTSKDYITGCAGISKDDYVLGCLNSYESDIGISSSTTENIYGIYDALGGAEEMIAAYTYNYTSIGSTSATSLINATDKYKDVYPQGTGSPHTIFHDYENAKDKKGDAVYETSSTGYGYNTWYTDFAGFQGFNYPFAIRGSYSYAAALGFTSFFYMSQGDGSADNANSFRPVLVVGSGL